MKKLYAPKEIPPIVNRQKRTLAYRVFIGVIPLAVTIIPFVLPLHTTVTQERGLTFLFSFSGGYLCFYLYTKKMYWFGPGFAYGAASIGCTALTSAFISFIFFHSGMMMCLASASAFCLPWFCIQSWRFYRKIPFTRFTDWSSPLSGTNDDHILLMSVTRICFYNETKEPLSESVFMETSVDCKLGKAFFSLVEKKNIPLDSTPCSWEFYHPSLWGLINKRMDPELSIRDNGIGNYAGILVKQVKHEEKNN